MAFTGGIQRSSQQGTYTQNSSDRLVVIESYDVSKSEMYVKDFADENKKYRVFIDPEEVVRVDKSIAEKNVNLSKVNWMGHKIDSKMESKLKVGSKIALSKAKSIGTDKTTGITSLQVQKINAFPDQKNNKIHQGFVSFTYAVVDNQKIVNRAYIWDEKAVDFDLNNDLKALNDLSTRINESIKDYGTKVGDFSVTKPTIGVQFRTLIKTDKEYEYAKEGQPKEIYEVIDISQPFDWIPGEKDEAGKEIKSKAHPMNGEEMMHYAEMYFTYISEKESFAALANEGKLKFEAVPYAASPVTRAEEFILTTGDANKDKNADKNPLYQLCHRKNYGDMENSQDGMIVGKNFAVNGIIGFSADKNHEDEEGNVKKVPSYWVSKIFANNIRGHVHNCVRTSDGAKCEVNDKLKLENTMKQESSNTNSSSASKEDSGSAPMQTAQYNSSVAESSTQSEEQEFNPFAMEEETPAPTTQKVSFGKKS